MKRLATYVLAVMLFANVTTFAKTINLYSEPRTDSKVTGVVNTESGVTIIYTPKTGEWIKVANPTNGDAGWVKSGDLGNNGYNMRLISSGDGAHRYSIYQFSTGSSQYNHQQLEKEMRQFEQQQHMMHVNMARLFNEMFYFPQPIFIPIILVPEQPKLKKASLGMASKAIQPAQANKG